MPGHTTESAFWQLLAYQLLAASEADIVQSLEPMSQRVRDLDLPIEFSPNKAVPWAFACRGYVLVKQNLPDATKWEFSLFRSNFGGVINPKGFFEHALTKLLDNIAAPAHPGRSAADSIADTFAISSVEYTLPIPLAEGLHPSVLAVLVNDPVIHQASLLAVAPAAKFWDEGVQRYLERRPGLLRRLFTDPRRW